MEESMSSGDAQKWVPRNERMASLMKVAKQRATEEHAQMERMRESSGTSERKPSKAVTKRQRSSKRSAEISRAKYGIYVTLLEEENEKELAEAKRLKELKVKYKKDICSVSEQIRRLEARLPSSRSRRGSAVWSVGAGAGGRVARDGESECPKEEQVGIVGMEMRVTNGSSSGSSGDGAGDGQLKQKEFEAAKRRREEMRIVKEKLKISNIIDPVPSTPPPPSPAPAPPPSTVAITAPGTAALPGDKVVKRYSSIDTLLAADAATTTAATVSMPLSMPMPVSMRTLATRNDQTSSVDSSGRSSLDGRATLGAPRSHANHDTPHDMDVAAGSSVDDRHSGESEDRNNTPDVDATVDAEVEADGTNVSRCENIIIKISGLYNDDYISACSAVY